MQSILVLFFVPAVSCAVLHHGALRGPDKTDQLNSYQVQSKAALPLAGKVHLSAEKEQHMHFGCLAACTPDANFVNFFGSVAKAVESKCVTSCEVAMYKCEDETGPNETPEDTKKCQDKVIAHFQETKGLSKEQADAYKAAEAKRLADEAAAKKQAEIDAAKDKLKAAEDKLKGAEGEAGDAKDKLKDHEGNADVDGAKDAAEDAEKGLTDAEKSAQLLKKQAEEQKKKCAEAKKACAAATEAVEKAEKEAAKADAKADEAKLMVDDEKKTAEKDEAKKDDLKEEVKAKKKDVKEAKKEVEEAKEALAKAEQK